MYVALWMLLLVEKDWSPGRLTTRRARKVLPPPPRPGGKARGWWV